MSFGPRKLIQLSLLYLPLNLFWTVMVLQLLPERIKSLTSGQVGVDFAFVSSSGALAATLCMFLVGPLSDNTVHRYGRRYPWIVGGILVGTVGAFLFALAKSLPVLLVAFVLARLGFAAAVAAYEAILPDRVPVQYQSRASGWNEMFDVLGQLVGLVFMAFVATAMAGYHLSPQVEAKITTVLICMGSTVVLWGVLFINREWIREAAMPREQALSWKAAIKSAFEWRPSDTPDFTRLYVSRCLLNVGIFTGADFLNFYVLKVLQIPEARVVEEVALIAFAVTAGGIFGAFIAGALGDMFSKRNLLYIFCSLAALAAAGFCFTNSVGTARWIAVIYGVGWSALNTLDWAFATSLVPRGREARFLSIFQTCFYLPKILVGFGGIIGEFCGYRVLYATIPFWLIAGMVLLSRVREPNQIRKSTLLQS